MHFYIGLFWCFCPVHFDPNGGLQKVLQGTLSTRVTPALVLIKPGMISWHVTEASGNAYGHQCSMVGWIGPWVLDAAVYCCSFQ